MAEDQKKPGNEVKPEDLASLWGSSQSAEKEETDSAAEIPKVKTPDVSQMRAERTEERPLAEENQKAVEAEIVPESSEPASEYLEETESFGDRLNNLLEEMNLSKKQIVFGCGCLVFLIVAIIFGIRFFTGDQEPKRPKAKQEEKTMAVSFDEKKTGIYGSFLFGKPFVLPSSFFTNGDIILSLILGKGEDRKSQFSYYVFHLKRMQNAYETDINALLSEATDRRAVLENHLGRLKTLLDEGNHIALKIDNELNRLKPLFDESLQKQSEFEKGFFEQINVFNPAADTFLGQFIEKAKETTEFKGRFRSLEQVKKFYNQALPKLEARIKDVALNKEPLIAGVKVYDVRGSDIQLIIIEEGARDRFETKNSALLKPIPSNKKQDFISNPGGGIGSP